MNLMRAQCNSNRCRVFIKRPGRGSGISYFHEPDSVIQGCPKAAHQSPISMETRQIDQCRLIGFPVNPNLDLLLHCSGELTRSFRKAKALVSRRYGGVIDIVLKLWNKNEGCRCPLSRKPPRDCWRG